MLEELLGRFPPLLPMVIFPIDSFVIIVNVTILLLKGPLIYLLLGLVQIGAYPIE